ncbi:MAG: F0F1 ATP synthase subunit A [Bacilli bacterium]
MSNFNTFYNSISPSLKSMVIITIIIAIIILITSHKLKKYKYTDEPKGLILIFEWLIDGMSGLCKMMVGKKYKQLGPYMVTVALLLFVYNIAGLFGFRPPTASVSVTFAFSITTFILMEVYGVACNGVKNWLHQFIEPVPLFLPLNIISDMVTPLSLGLRIFGNILSGVIIMSMVYAVCGWFSVILAPVLHLYFDVFTGYIQTLVFVSLTLVFIGNKLPESDLELEEDK